MLKNPFSRGLMEFIYAFSNFFTGVSQLELVLHYVFLF